MDNTHIVIIIIIFSIFSICGLVCGLIIHGEAPKYIQEKSTVKNSLVVIIVSLVFVILFDLVYFGWHALHNRKVKFPRDNTHPTQVGRPSHLSHPTQVGRPSHLSHPTQVGHLYPTQVGHLYRNIDMSPG